MHLSLGENIFTIDDPTRIYHINYWIYVFMGFWKYESGIYWKEILYKTYQFVVSCLYGVTISLFFIDAVAVRHDLDKLSFNMTSSVLVFITIVKITMLRLRRSNLESVLSSLDNDLNVKLLGESEENREIFKKRAELILHFTRLFYGLLVVCYSLRVLADTALDTRSYLIPIPFKERLDDHYEIIYAQQIVVVTHFLITVLSHDLLIYGVVNRLIAHFEVIENNFLKVKTLHPQVNFEEYVTGYRDQTESVHDVYFLKIFLNEVGDVNKKQFYNRINQAEKAKLAKQLLTDSIQHHQKLLKEIIKFSKIYSRPFVIQVLGTILLIGIVAVKILFLSNKITPLLVQQIMYVGITFLNNLHICSFATELTTKSLAAANALYDVPWYEMDVKNRKILHFTMKKLMTEPKLKGGGMIVINRVTYLKMLQTSYNMMVVLRNVY